MTEKTKTVKVLTIHNVMGEKQIFNNQGYSWVITAWDVQIIRNDGKWHAYFPMANVVMVEVEELKK